MGIKINNLNVDEAYSPIVEKALFEDTVLIPGVTYTDKYFENAGKIYIHKESKQSISAGAPGRDFVSTNVADTLVEIPVNQNFQSDKKIYNVQVAQVGYDVIASQVDLTGKEIGSARQKVGLVKMAKEATDLEDTTTITSLNVKKMFTKIRKELRDNGSRFDFAIVSTSVYAAILEDKANFAPSMNDEQLKSGIVGRYLGADILEGNALSGLVKPHGDQTAYDLTLVDVIAGQNDAFAIVDQIDMLRAKDSENFNGVRVQAEANCGFKVVNPDKLIVKLHLEEVEEGGEA